MRNKIRQNPRFMDSMLCFVSLLWFVFLRGLWALVLHPGPCLQSENRQAQSKPDSFSSVLFSTSLITTFLPFGHRSSSPFPRVARPPPGCRKEAIDSMFLRMMGRGVGVGSQQRGPCLPRFAAQPQTCFPGAGRCEHGAHHRAAS